MVVTFIVITYMHYECECGVVLLLVTIITSVSVSVRNGLTFESLIDLCYAGTS